MSENSSTVVKPKPWYTKKRFIIPLVLVGIGIIGNLTAPKPAPTYIVNGANATTSAGASIITNNQPKSGEVIVDFNTVFPIDGFNLKVEKAEWLDNIVNDNQFFKPYEAKKKILKLTFDGENTSKVGKNLSFYNAKINTKDGFEFSKIQDINVTSMEQVKDLPKGYTGCLSCKVEPLGKAKEYIYFDIPEKPLTDLNLSIRDTKIKLQ